MRIGCTSVRALALVDIRHNVNHNQKAVLNLGDAWGGRIIKYSENFMFQLAVVAVIIITNQLMSCLAQVICVIFLMSGYAGH